MKILPIHSLHHDSSLKNNKKDLRTTPININFCSFSSWLVYLVAREGLATIAKKDSYKYVKDLNNCIKSYDMEMFRQGIAAISKTPNLYYNDKMSRIGILAYLGGEVDFIKDLRWTGLKKLNKIPDNNYQKKTL